MRAYIREHKWPESKFIQNHGWGNGYVLIPVGHPLYGINHEKMNFDVHRGLTYSKEVNDQMVKTWEGLTEEDEGMWIIGFDTTFPDDTLENCTKEYVQAEADKLLRIVKSYKR
jgi:hypothetical protein